MEKRDYVFSFLQNTALRCEFNGITEINSTIKRIEEVISNNNYSINKGTIQSMEMSDSFSKRFQNEFDVNEDTICYRLIEKKSFMEIYFSEYFLEFSINSHNVYSFEEVIDLFVKMLFAIKDDNKFINMNYIICRELHQTTSTKLKNMEKLFNSDFLSLINDKILGENQVQSLEKFISLNTDEVFCEIISAIDEVEIENNEIGLLITLDVLSLKELEVGNLNCKLIESSLEELAGTNSKIFNSAIKPELKNILQGMEVNQYGLRLVNINGEE